MPHSGETRPRHAKPRNTGGGSTASLSSSPTLEPLLRDGSVEHISDDASVISQYVSFLDAQWGDETWQPPTSWHRSPNKDVMITDADVCNIRAMTVIAQHRRDKFTSLGVLYGRAECGFIRAAATPAGSGTATWRLSTSTKALNLMREHLADDPAAPFQAQAQDPKPLSPEAPVHRTTARSPDSHNGTPNSRPSLSVVTRAESSNPAANPPLAGPAEDDFPPELHQTALELLGNPEKPLDAEVVNFLQHRFKSSILGDANLIHPDYFRFFYPSQPRTAADHAETDRVVEEILPRRESIAAIYHPWDRRCWTLASLWPDESAKTLTVLHYDPTPSREAKPTTGTLQNKFKAWVQANFNHWKLAWEVVEGPRGQTREDSGVFVVLGMIELMNNRKIHPNSWPSSKARKNLQRQVAQLKDQSITLAHRGAQTPKRDSRQPKIDSPRRNDNALKNGSHLMNGSPPRKHSLSRNYSPLSVDSGVFCRRWDNSPCSPGGQETHDTFPGRLPIRQSSPITPTGSRRRSRGHSMDSQPNSAEGPASPITQIGNRKRSRDQSVDSQSTSSEEPASLITPTGNRKRSRDQSMDSQPTIAEEPESPSKKARQYQSFISNSLAEAEKPKTFVTGAMADYSSLVGGVHMQMMAVQRNLAQEAAMKMMEAKTKADEAREIVVTKNQLLADVKASVAAFTRDLLSWCGGEDVRDALDAWMALDTDSDTDSVDTDSD